MKPILSVVVCTYNRQDLLPGCLQSLVQQTQDKSLYEVIVVNNNSTDGSYEIARKFADSNENFRVVTETKQGLSNARNRGITEARGEFISYLDDDAKAEPDWCQRIVDAFQTVAPRPVAVGGEIHPWYETTPPKWFTDDLEIRTWGTDKGFLQPPRAPFGFSGSNMAFPVEVLKKYGGFSPEFGMVGTKIALGDETELFMRIYREYPYFWYDPQIQVKHWVPVRNMQAWYRLKRSYKAGISSARINGEKFKVKEYLGLWKGLLCDILSEVVKFPWSSNKRMRLFISKGEQYAARLGTLIAYYGCIGDPSSDRNRARPD